MVVSRGHGNKTIRENEVLTTSLIWSQRGVGCQRINRVLRAKQTLRRVTEFFSSVHDNRYLYKKGKHENDSSIGHRFNKDYKDRVVY